MLISPKNKFIFFKPMKCAGSSIEKSLLAYCTKDALCTGGSSVSPEHKNYKQFDEYKSQNNIFTNEENELCIRFHSHTWPSLFFSKIKNKEVYNDYKKITVIRNPWEQVLSFYWWTMMSANNCPIKQKCVITNADSKNKARKKFKMWTKIKFYFPSIVQKDILEIKKSAIDYLGIINEKFIDNAITDYIRYENLKRDYNTVFNKLISLDNKVPNLEKLKAKNKKIKKHYRFFYDYESREYVEKTFLETIKKFNYKF